MSGAPYKYNSVNGYRYNFISCGKKTIIKAVEFTPTSAKNIYNLGFGDRLTNGEIDDMANSNNGDIIKVFATVIDIVQDFTKRHPSFTILFLGSTHKRMALYNRILRTYYQSFSKEFIVIGLIEEKEGIKKVPFDPSNNLFYDAFLVTRI